MPRDPRLDDIPRTVNEVIQDRAIRHGIFIERFKAGEVRRILDLYDEVLPDLLDQIEQRLNRIDERGFDTGPATTERLQQMASAIDTATRDLRDRSQARLTSNMFDLAGDEVAFQAGVIKQALPVTFDMVLPSAQTLRSVVTARPFDGRLLKDWFRGLETAQRDGLKSAVRIGITEGETVQQIARRIRGTRARNFIDGVVALNRRQAEAVVRTTVTHVSTHAREATFEANQDLVKGAQWVSTLDARTCPECMALDGKVFDPGKGRRPPAHIGCRCTTAPVLRSWKEIGIDLNEAPPGTRASMNGQVTDTVTYGKWLEGQPPEIQNDALGATRARLFRKGQLKVESFTNRRGNVLNLSDLRRKDRDAFISAGLMEDLTPEEVAILSDKARSLVVQRGKETQWEWLSAFDEVTGEQIAEHTSGNVGFVGFTQAFVDAASDPNRRIIAHHNHPSSSSLSRADIVGTARFPGLKKLFANGHDGSIYSVSASGPRVQRAYDKARTAFSAEIRAAERSGQIPPDVVARLAHHALNLALDRAGVIEYEAVLPLQKQALFDRFSGPLDRAMRAARRAADVL